MYVHNYRKPQFSILNAVPMTRALSHTQPPYRQHLPASWLGISKGFRSGRDSLKPDRVYIGDSASVPYYRGR